MTDPSAMLAFPYPHRIHPLHALFGDAFRTYQPIGQQERMVLLFQGLCRAAGIIPEKVSAPPRAPVPIAPHERQRASVVVAIRGLSQSGVKAPHGA
jgi:hypothetical protein